jgi:hypothetical protein
VWGRKKVGGLKKYLTTFFGGGIGLKNPILLCSSFKKIEMKGGEGISRERR